QTMLACTVDGDATIESNALINLDFKGYPARTGPGAGGTTAIVGVTTGGGGGHGGFGGIGATNAAGGASYDTVSSPGTGFGSGGGANIGAGGSEGGGAIQLTIGGALLLDGKITANGDDAAVFAAGGGSGGSVYLTVVGTLAGAGTISANGGAGADDLGGGGGGGRIFISSQTNNFTGNIVARGGDGYVAGGAGTIYLTPTISGFPSLILDNGGVSGANTPTAYISGVSYVNFIITGAASATNNPGYDLSQLENLFVGTNSSLTGSASMTVRSNATIQAGGKISVDGVNSGGQGSGTSINGFGGGGGHGGYGGSGTNYYFYSAGGYSYDSISSPNLFGSVGGPGSGSPSAGGYGGGAIHLTVNGVLQLDGKISADGMSGPGTNSGGGSGGSVWLTVGTFSGAGTISANGGAANGALGGGGGGGRIAISFNTNLFSGGFAAHGGEGFVAGGAGTIYLAPSQVGGIIPLLSVDNGGMNGAGTPLNTGLPAPINLTITGAAAATDITGYSIENLLIGTNSSLVPQSISTILSNATIQAGGKIFGDGVSQSGPGNGISINGTGSGGGHGGYGGIGTGGAHGGNVYDSFTQPTATGSAG
ncbi:MAG: hypothetical protein ACREFE_19080, partial [Limisphaerales bacterium]